MMTTEGQPPSAPSSAASTAPSAEQSTGPVTLPGPAATHPVPAGPGTRRRPAWLWVAVIAATAFALEMAVSGRYGYARDELYFLTAGQHPAAGYVDQPSLTPLLSRLASLATGNTLVGLRALPALVLAAVVLITAEISRLLGAGKTGRILAALATATCGEYLGAFHELTTTTPDFLFWAITLLLVTCLLTSQNPRWWPAIGAAVGAGASAKWNIGFLVAALAAGLLATPARRLLRSRWLLVAAILAAGLAAPDVAWQAAHGWPNLDVFRSLQGAAGANRISYWIAQVFFTGPALTPVWVAGLLWTLRNPAARAVRPAGIACGLVIIVQFILGGKPYYPGGAYVFLFAAGAIPVEHWLATRKPLAGRIRPAAVMGGVMLVSAAIGLPIALPVLPARALHYVPLQKINYDLAESIAWPKQVALIARQYDRLPAGERRHTTILTQNYGEAGALSRYGAGYGLPEAYSGANNFWLWGPPPATATSAITVGLDPALLRREFRQVRLVATFRNGLGVDDDEQGVQLYLATGLKSSWATSWAAFRDYG